jgi:hypothetical protein
MNVWPLLVAALLYAGLLFVSAFVFSHSIEGAVKALKLALKSEFTTDTGRINLAGMILLVVFFFFSNLHEMVTTALSTERPPGPEEHFVAPATLLGLFFFGSLICVLIMERKDK